MVQEILDQIRILWDEKCRQVEDYVKEYELLESKYNSLSSEYKTLKEDFSALKSKWDEFLGKISQEMIKNAIPPK
jgi:predicted nuclease with TOPRIM domain